MKKLIILSIFALGFSSISPTFAAEMADSGNLPTIQESVSNVLPISLDVKTPVQAVDVTTASVAIPVVAPSPMPSGTVPNHLPSPAKDLDTGNETIAVIIPCASTCPNPNPVITPINEVYVTPCLDSVPAAFVDASTSQADRIIIPIDPCSSITPVNEVTVTGTGGGAVIFPTPVLPVNDPVEVETSTEVPGQKVLGEKKVETKKITSPSFPKTGGAPSAPITPTTATTTLNAIINFSFSNDRKRQHPIV